MNKNRTCADSDAKLTQPRSGPVLYELIGADGKRRAIFKSAQQAAETAKRIWPDQEQDEDRTGKGWDVQVVGCE